MSSSNFRGLATLALSTSLVALSAPAFAQQLDEIIVTAQKKTENLQDVPVAITAFDLTALQNSRIEGIEDIGRNTPGMYVTQNPADPNGVRISIRGIGTFDPQVGQDSRVAIYQDGVYLGKTQGLGFDMPDLARVEVLKGPQGTLYGRNTVAGAINLVSARPDPSELSGKINAEYGNYDHMKISGAVNVPMAETAAFRLSGLYMKRDGWVENTGAGADFAGEEKYGVRAAFGFEVGSDVRIDMAADYNETKKQPLFYQSVGAGAQPFSAALPAPVQGRQETTSTAFDNEAGDLETYGANIVGTWDIDENNELKLTAAYRSVASNRYVNLIPETNPAILNQITGGFNQALAPLPFTGVGLRSDWGTAFNGAEAERGLFQSPPGGSSNLPDHDQFSLEATYNGSFADGRFEYTGGAFYYDESTGTGPGVPNTANANDYLFVLGAFNPLVTPAATRGFLGGFGVPASAQGPIPGALALLNFVGIPGPIGQQAQGHLAGLNALNSAFLGAARQSASNTLDIETQAFAIYGQATYHVSDDFRITGGLRFSDESKDGVGQAKSPFFNDNIDLTGNLIEPLIGNYDESILDPSLTLEYDVNDDMMLYASYKESFRSGGFNNSAVGLRIPGQTYSRDFKFGREDITAYEAGFKGDFGGRLRLNAAAFYYDFTDKQVTLALNPIIATERAVVNTDDEVYGFEVDGQYAVNDAITLRGSYSYVDGEAGDTVNPNNPADVRSFPELQGTPKSSYLVAVDYNGDNGLFGNVTYSHKDDILSIPESALRLPAIDLVSGRLGMNFDGGASVALWGTNLLDEEYLIDALPFNTFSYNGQVYGQPRSYGVSLGYNF
ncbi:MAG: TonB-dependent receptor [Maricaulaceae bacterium]